MEKKDLKYLLAYIPVLAAIYGLYLGGVWTFSALIIAFVIVPILEIFLPGTDRNHSESIAEQRVNIKLFDLLLYSNLVLLYGLLAYYFYSLTHQPWTTLEVVGATSSVAVIVGSLGINVAHELGHRQNAFDQFVSKSLLLPALYMHFNIEHNLGHHKLVGTDKDPASARFGENIYAFWWRSTVGGYKSAWAIERMRLKRSEISFWSLQNEMIRFQLFQISYLIVVGLIFGWSIIPYAIVVAVGGFLLLETVNYIEHYGLRRKLLPSGRYENVTPKHSWNSNHEVGRILLYELTRHADHHYKATRKYQVLRHIDESPQLPSGYPGAMLMSLIPPLWFRVMNKRVLKHQDVTV